MEGCGNGRGTQKHNRKAKRNFPLGKAWKTLLLPVEVVVLQTKLDTTLFIVKYFLIRPFVPHGSVTIAVR